MLEIILVSTSAVALAEIGDKTQLLAILLATRFSNPWPIIAGIFVATMANHFLAALAGSEVAGFFSGPWFRYVVGASFIAVGAWMLIPDKVDDASADSDRFGAFVTTVIAFFLVEIGDKTQVATVVLGARYHEVVPVTIGTTLGMMIANVPAVFLGHELLTHLPMNVVRLTAAGLFLVIGALVILI
jgi:putative Ca2+/H+ antiporter (TMEM165/GDT1 family)